MIVELHVIQNFAPSNLNRDDTGAPKDTDFGGYRRARISSQCVKRSVRRLLRSQGTLGDAYLGTRTRRLQERIARELTSRGRDGEPARQVADAALASIGLQAGEDGNSDFLVFVGADEVKAFADVCESAWNDLFAVAESADRNAKEGKKRGKRIYESVGDPLKRDMHAALKGGEAVDIALFGRMIATAPDRNVEAASQVAHAISTNRVSMEFDFYTAVDDLQTRAETGAGMMGTVEFNSSCFYRYANVHLPQLVRNLNDDRDLARRGLEAFVRGFVEATPSGKQNSFAAYNPPSLVLAEVRRGQPMSYANAFVRPVAPDERSDLIQESIRKLADYRERVRSAYGGDQVGAWVVLLDDGAPASLTSLRVRNLDALVTHVVNAGWQAALV